ncbi:MAG: hypothetical protein QOD53_1187, partial [Thermoleophilaceae bacterium]|nr:hypothetical protein [Thermoleophilaceae bacterium]
SASVGWQLWLAAFMWQYNQVTL